MQAQLTLDVTLQSRASFQNFFVGDNGAVYSVLQQFYHGKKERFVYLWGEHGTGKTHLLEACCHTFNQHGQRIVYLPLREHARFLPTILEGLEYLALLCIDDIDQVAKIQEWEQALFHCYNRLLDSGCQLLISGNNAPQHLSLQMPDLRSRLAQGMIFQLQPLTDEQKLQLLQQQALARGFTLQDEVASYLLTRCSRGIKQLFIVLDRLDRASLSAQHRLTIPFVKQVLF